LIGWTAEAIFAAMTTQIGGSMTRMHTGLNRRDALLTAAAVAMAALSACAGSGSPGAEDPAPADQALVDLEPGGMVLTAEDIRRSGARDAMEAIERSRSHLLIARTREGTPATISHRGVDSFVVSKEVLLVVDGTRVSRPVQALKGIPARSILYIQILSGREAVMRWGSESTNGVIVVRTSAR
jgi:outer membrane cobalamin receptor